MSCGESKEELKVMVGYFVEVCRRGLKFNVDESKVRVLGGEEGLLCEDAIRSLVNARS